VSDVITNAMAWLDTQRKAHMSRSVTYSRGADSVTLSATPGSTQYEGVDDEGMTAQGMAHDWIFTAADLVIDGELTVPQLHDRITDGTGDSPVEYEVLDLAGIGHYRQRGPQMRVHTKRVAGAESS